MASQRSEAESINTEVLRLKTVTEKNEAEKSKFQTCWKEKTHALATLMDCFINGSLLITCYTLSTEESDPK